MTRLFTELKITVKEKRFGSIQDTELDSTAVSLQKTSGTAAESGKDGSTGPKGGRLFGEGIMAMCLTVIQLCKKSEHYVFPSHLI